MAKNEVDLDNMDLEDFDFGIPEWNADEEVDEKSRSPITRAAKGALSGAKNEIATPMALRKALAMALPSGYGLAADTLEEGADGVRSLYDTITGESPELVRSSKSFGRKSMQLLGNKILPKDVADRLNLAMEESDDDASVKSSADYRREQEESDIAQLAEIFKAKAGADEEHALQDASDKLESKAMDQARFKTNIQYLSSINRSMARLVGYQDKIAAKYQQKMLELNYRQYATQKQLLDLMSESTKKQTLILETIRHNTALPEAVKIRGSEMFGQLARQKLLGSGLNTISNWTQNYGKQLLTNVKGVADGILDPIRDAQSMSGDLGEGVDKVNVGGRAVGSMIGGAVRDHASMYLAPHLAKNKFIAKGGEKLRKTFTGLPQKMNEYAQSETEGTGYKSVMKQMFKTFLPQFSLDSRTGGDSVDLLDESASFDKIARRSLIEVIPGYLSEIAHWSKVAVTGEKDSEKQVFNVVRGGFTSQKEHLTDVSRQIMSRSERDSLRSSAEDFIQSIGGDTLSSKTQRALKKKLLDELANGHDLVPKRLADPAEYPNVDPDTVEEITSLIIDSFGLDYNGEMADKSTESAAKFNDIRDKYLSMASMVPAAGDRIRVLGDVLGKDSLRKLGFIERQGREDRINFDKIWSDIVDENDEEGPIGGDESSADDNDRNSKHSGRALQSGKVRNPNAARASRTDRMVSRSQEKRVKGEGGGLDFFLGDKSTLITLITQSRDFHAEEVDLLKQLAACGCPGEPRGNRGSEIMDSARAHAKRAKANGTKLVTAAHTKAVDSFKFGQEKYGEAKTLVQDIWIEGEDHPRLQEAKMKAGEYRDKATNEVIKRWEDISGDVVDLKDKVVVSYNEILDSGVLTDYKGKVVKRASDLMGDFKSSKAGAMTKTAFQGGMERFDKLSARVRPTLESKGEAVSKELTNQRKKFRPRLKRMMSRFTGGKLGSDVSSELTGDQEQDMLTLALRSVQLQYETLKQVTTEKVRKGSFQEINAKRKNWIEEGKDKLKDKGDDVKGLLGKAGGLSGLLAMLGGGRDGADGEDGGGGWMRDIGDLFGGGGDDKDKKDKKRNKTNKRRGGRKGLFGKLTNMGGRALDKMGRFGKIAKFGGKTLGKAARLGWGATKMLGRGLKGTASIGRAILTNPLTRMVAGHAGRWAIGAAMGAAGLVSAPVLAAIGVGIGVVAIGGYIYSKTRDKLAPLTRLRMVQYGIKPKTESDELTLIGGLEKIFAGVTSVDAEGKATINTKSLPQDQIMELFKIDTNIPPEENSAFKRLTQYLSGRFSAVFLVHVSNLYALTKSTDLSKVDEKLTGKVAMSFADKVGMQDRSDVFNARIGPFKDEKLPMDADDVASMWAEVKAELEKAMKKEIIDNSPAAKSIAGSIAIKVIESKAKDMVKENKKAAEKSGVAEVGEDGAPKEATEAVLSKTEVKMVDGVAVVTSSMTEKGKTVLATMEYQSSSFDTGKAVRFRAYGLTEMMVMKVSQLDTLEYALFKQVRYGNEKDATFDDDKAAWQVVESLFSPIGGEVDKTYKWFQRRFKPAFLQFCSSVRARSSMDARDAAKRLKPELYLEVLREVANASDGSGASVWDVVESPWPGYILNSDKESVKEALYLLSTKIKDKAIIENAGPVAGQVLDKDGKIIEQDANQTNRPATADGQGGSGSGGGAGTGGDDKPGMFSSAWSGIKSFFGGGDDKSKAPQTGHVNSSGQQTATGMTEFPPGTPLNHPGGGTGGSVNELPAPKGDGWETNKETLMAAANMVGVDPNLAASIAGVESNYRPNAVPYKNPRNPSAGVLSSAASYYQVINATWKELMGKYAKKYGIHPNTTQHDPRANALLGLEFIRENVNGIKKVKSNVTDTDVYLSHFLGPSGGPRFLKAPPGDPAINHVGASQASSNPSIFYKNGRPRTVADVYNDFDAKLTRHRKPDATSLATSLKSGAALADPSVAEVETPSDEMAAGGTALEVTPPEAPSMVKPSVPEGDTVSPAANTVVEETPSTDTADLTEKADTRQTQNTTAGLAMSAKTAEVQTATQSAANTETYGGMDKQMGRLLDVNQSQLTQLLTLVELVKQGGAAVMSASSSAQGGSTQTSVNPNINNPKAATRGTVAVSRT